jgi:hypothetical protein
MEESMQPAGKVFPGQSRGCRNVEDREEDDEQECFYSLAYTFINVLPETWQVL